MSAEEIFNGINDHYKKGLLEVAHDRYFCLIACTHCKINNNSTAWCRYDCPDKKEIVLSMLHKAYPEILL